MSKHKSIPKNLRIKIYDKYNHRCAYCGCELEYKDLQIDHIKSVYKYTDNVKEMTEEEMYREDNLLPTCRQCNFYKSTFDLEEFRERLTKTMMKNVRKDFGYRLGLKYGLIKEDIKPIIFYFETLNI